MDNQRNLILAVVLCLALLLGFDLAMGWLYPEPAPSERVTAQADTPAQQVAIQEGPGAAAAQARDLRTALASRDRIRIDAPEVAGSINPVGARIDDIVLKTHRQAVARDSGPVRLFSPDGTPAQQFAQFGWIGQGVRLPDHDHVLIGREGGIERDFAQMREELSAALARATAGKGDPPRKRKR